MGHRVFVTEIRPQTNEVVIGENADLFRKTLIADQVNFMAMPQLQPGEVKQVMAKIRYNHKGAPAQICMQEDGTVRCTFDEPQRAMTPGQAAVFYEGENVLGGGIILRSEE